MPAHHADSAAQYMGSIENAPDFRFFGDERASEDVSKPHFIWDYYTFLLKKGGSKHNFEGDKTNSRVVAPHSN